MSNNPSQWWGQQTSAWSSTPASSASQSTAQDISIPADVLNQAREIQDVPHITNLRADQRVAEVEVSNTDGSVDRFILVVQQQKSATQWSFPHPGKASYYDDCVSDYSHERARHSQPSQISHTKKQKRTSADYGRMPEILAANAAKAQANAAQSVFSAPLGENFVFMPSGVGNKLGEWFQVLQVYTVKAATKGKAIGSQTKAGMRQGATKLRPVVAHLVSLGKELVSDIEKAGSAAAQIESNRGSHQSHRAQRPRILVMPSHNKIDPSIPVLPREVVLVNDLRRRAAQTLPAMPPPQKVSRKPAPLPREGPLSKIVLPQPRDRQARTAQRDALGRKKVAQPMAVWEEAGYEPPPRALKPKEKKPVINPAYEVRSQHASLASVSAAGSRASHSTVMSSGHSTLQ